MDLAPPEDPWDAWRKRHGLPEFPAFMAEFEREFSRMQGMIEKIMEDAMKHASGPRRGDPFVYGFSMRVGPDGVPRIQPFGSAMGQTPTLPEGEPQMREPLTDVQESQTELFVTVELPGVEKGDVNLHVTEDQVSVKVEKGRRYAARVQLPAKVVPSSAKATFKNGILDVTLQKAPEADNGQRVAID